MWAFSPTGVLIEGTLEEGTGRANLYPDTFEREENGIMSFDYSGDTDNLYDDQETVEIEGQRVFLDANGDMWLESQLVLTDDEDFKGNPKTQEQPLAAMPAFGTRNYNQLAAQFKELRRTASNDAMRNWFDLVVLVELCEFFKHDNPAFSKEKFLKACDFAVPTSEGDRS